MNSAHGPYYFFLFAQMPTNNLPINAESQLVFKVAIFHSWFYFNTNNVNFEWLDGLQTYPNLSYVCNGLT